MPTRLTLRLDDDVASRMMRVANINRRSLNAEIAMACEQWLALQAAEVPTTIVSKRKGRG
jgi:predicted transcriptional regulator